MDAFVATAQAGIAQGAYRLHGAARRNHGSLVRALSQSPVVAELKASSPSEGPLLTGAPAAYLQQVAQARPAGISIVTAGGAFGGAPALIQEAHAHTAGRPLLMKDFILDAAQLDFAAHAGASAVLLIEACLEPERREALVRQAHDRGLEVLLEAAGSAQAKRASASRADLLGVNARDLIDLRVDPAAGLRVVRELAAMGSAPVLLLSGTRHPADVQAALQAGARGVLVGTSLLKAAAPAVACLGLQRPIAKVCGLSRSSDVAAAAVAGADLAGVVVECDSPRSVDRTDAAHLAAALRRQGVPSVMVTRGLSLAELEELQRTVRADFLQPHLTALSPKQQAALSPQLLQPVGPAETPRGPCAAFVLDTSGEGGSGAPHAWTPRTQAPCLVAGGLDASQAGRAIAASEAWGADASSRLESNGRKDPRKVLAFVDAVHAARRLHVAA